MEFRIMNAVRAIAFGLAIGLGLASAQAADTLSLKPGDKVKLGSTYGMIPAFYNEQGYKDFLALVKTGSDTRIKAMIPDVMDLLTSGVEVTVVSGGETSGKRPSLASLVAVGLVPAIVVRQPKSERPLWVPAFYARNEGSKAYSIEARFPVIAMVFDREAIPKPGLVMVIYHPELIGVFVAADASGYDEMMRCINSVDKVRLSDLVKDKRVTEVPSGTLLIMIERHANGASEFRFLDGPHKDAIGWVPETFAALPTLKILSYASAKKAAGTPKK